MYHIISIYDMGATDIVDDDDGGNGDINNNGNGNDYNEWTEIPNA